MQQCCCGAAVPPTIEKNDEFVMTIFFYVIDIVVLTAEASKCVRQSLQMLLKDGDRRQDLVQDMIVTNNQLRYV